MKRFYATMGLLFLLGASTVPSSAQAADAYPLKLRRVFHVGDKYRTQAHSVDSATSGESRRVATIEVTAIIEVTATSPEGLMTAAKVTIESGKIDLGGRTMDLAPPPATDSGPGPGPIALTVGVTDDKSVLTDPGSRFAPPFLKALQSSRIFTVSTGRAGLRDLYSTSTPVGAGSTWALDGAAAAAQLSERGMRVAAEHVQGSATVNTVTPTSRGAAVLDVVATFAASELSLDKPGVRTTGGTLTAEFSGSVPSSSRGPVLRSTEKMSMSLTLVEGETGEGQTLQVAFSHTKTTTNTPL